MNLLGRCIKPERAIILIFVCWLCADLTAANAVTKLSAKDFAGSDQKLNEQEAAMYIVFRDKEPLSKFLSPGETKLDAKKVVAAMADKLDDLRSKTGHIAPWTWQELDKAYPTEQENATKGAKLPNWKEVGGLTSKKELGKDGQYGNLGPIRLRKSSLDLTKDIKDAKGANIGFSYNRLASGGPAWNSQGIVDYPYSLICQGGTAQSLEIQFGPAVDWNLAQVQADHKKNVEELAFSLPITAYFSPGRRKMTGTYEENIAAAGDEIFSRLWIVQAKPYFQTDFGFRDEIYGVQASAEYVGGLFTGPIYLGGFQNLGKTGLQYQLRILPGLDYSVTEQGGKYTTRKKGEDWVRLGGTVSFDLRLGGKTFNPLDLGVSYQFLDTLGGSGGFSDLFKAHVTWWLNEIIGPTLEYSKGDTPVAEKAIDLLTLGVEVKY